MITEALQHCPGIGPARLARLHTAGLRSWDDILERSELLPPRLRDALLEEAQRCRTALASEDIRYFVDRFKAVDKWRIVAHYLDFATFFDIETTGLDYDASISVIVSWHRGQLYRFVEHENLDDFLELLDEVKLLVSFNGSSFDVPRVLDAFHIPELPCPHVDLRWSYYHRGMRGGLKEIASRNGIQRPGDLHDADGALAVYLWNRWQMARDQAARDKLLRYCSSDVLLLVMLAQRLAARSNVSDDELWDHLSRQVSAFEPTNASRKRRTHVA